MSDTTLALQQATGLKASVHDTPMGQAAPIPVEQWFRATLSPDTHVTSRFVPYSSLTSFSDDEYERWMQPHEDMRHFTSNDSVERLKEWLEHVSVEELAGRLLAVPRQLAVAGATEAIVFTPWQRLLMSCVIDPPFVRSSKVYLGGEQLMDLTSTGGSTRTAPIQAQAYLPAHAVPDIVLFDPPTASGKSAMSIAIAGMMLTGQRYQLLRAEARHKTAIAMGDPLQPVARLAILAVTSTTFDHFVSTARRILPALEALPDAPKFQIWTSIGASCNVRVARDLPENAAVFWIIPAKKLMEVLRVCPECSVAVCVIDEYNIDTPKERYRTMQSKLIKQFILQATPQVLQQVTKGNRSLLRDHFGGFLWSPRSILRNIEQRSWSDAQLGSEQMVRLHMMSVGHFRPYVRADLASLVPPGFAVHCLASKRRTLSSLLMQSQAELVPASLVNVLLRSLNSISLLTRDARRDFEVKLREHVVLTPQTIRTLFTEFMTANPDSFATSSSYAEANRGAITRLLSRVDEFVTSCPICMCDEPTTMNIFPCCGYCVCEECYQACPTRCAFCRTPVAANFRREEVSVLPPPEPLANETNLDPYPSAPTSINIAQPLGDTLSRLTSPNNGQLRNLALALHVLKAYGYMRFLVLVERYNCGDDELLATQVDLVRLGSMTGVVLDRIDLLLGGKGKAFTVVKRRFDEAGGTPRALFSYGMPEALLTGTNLDCVDAVVTVGNIPSKLLTQALNRIFRPRASRNNGEWIRFIKIMSV